jgi:hypothetical protein
MDVLSYRYGSAPAGGAVNPTKQGRVVPGQVTVCTVAPAAITFSSQREQADRKAEVAD